MAKTVVTSLSEVGWTVYRVRTSASQYHLAVFEGLLERRKCAVLRGMSQGLRREIDLQDSAPLIGGKCLFEVPPSQWIGKQLEIATATTSPVQSVEEEQDRGILTSITSAIALANGDQQQPARTSVGEAARRQQRESEWAPYPENFVEHVEIAASLLRSVYWRKLLLEDLRARPELLERFQVALSECLLMIKEVGGRLVEGRRGP